MNQLYIEHHRKHLLREAETERLIRTMRATLALRNLPTGLRRRLTTLKNER